MIDPRGSLIMHALSLAKLATVAISLVMVLFSKWGRAQTGPDPYSSDLPPLETPYPRLSGLRSSPFGFSVALGGGAVQLPQALSDRERLGNPYGIGMSLRASFLSFIFVDAGFARLFAEDHASFSETACPILGGDCRNVTSGVGGGSLHIKGGPLLRVFVPAGKDAIQLAGAAGLGFRPVFLSRSIEKCDGCSEQDIHVDGGAFLSPELSISWATNGGGKDRLAGALGLRFEYDRYLSGDATSSFWVSAFAEVM